MNDREKRQKAKGKRQKAWLGLCAFRFPLSAFPLCLLALLLLSGCKSPETADNEASRPWNAPRNWETGLPGFNNYERR